MSTRGRRTRRSRWAPSWMLVRICDWLHSSIWEIKRSITGSKISVLQAGWTCPPTYACWTSSPAQSLPQARTLQIWPFQLPRTLWLCHLAAWLQVCRDNKEQRSKWRMRARGRRKSTAWTGSSRSILYRFQFCKVVDFVNTVRRPPWLVTKHLFQSSSF